MAEQAPDTSSKTTARDLLVGVFGFATCLLTAVILWWIETRSGFAFYTWTFWFVIPVWAVFSGFVGASGYYAGAWVLNHRPTPLLFLNIVLASVGTFFLVHYLSFVTMQVDDVSAREVISFPQFLDIVIRSMSMGFRVRSADVGATGELGGWGYLVALLQVGGFAVGGLTVYLYLESKPCCDRCSRYMSKKGEPLRHLGNAKALQELTAQILQSVNAGDIALALQQQQSFGNEAYQKGNDLSSVAEVLNCTKCGQHWVKFSVEKWSRDEWTEIPELTVAAFTDEAVDLSATT